MSLMLLDSASLYFRAFYGVPDTLRGPNGSSNNAIRGFLDMISNLVDRFAPEALVACMDNDWRPAFRVDAISSYKAHRVGDPASGAEEVPAELEAQVPAIIGVLDAIGLCRAGVDGYEADDVIGTLAIQHPGPVDVVTGDRDLFQVIDDAKGVRVIYTARGMSNLQVMDGAALHERYAVHPAQYADFAALRGDPSDGLPGVQGIGEKTAATLLQRFGDLTALRAAAAADDESLKPAQKTNLLAASDYLDQAPTVVEVRRDLDVAVHPQLPAEPRDQEALDELCAEWGIDSPVGRLLKTLQARSG